MSHQFRSFLFMTALVSLTAGCASTGVTRTQASAVSLDDIRAKIAQQKDQVNTTIAALNLLPGLEGKSLQKQFNIFISELNRTEALQKKVAILSDNLRYRRDDYLSKWESEINTFEDPDIKARSQQRLEAVRADFAAVIEKGTASKAAFEPYLNYLRQIKKYLSLDLTTGGVESIKDLIERTNEETRKIYASIDEFSTVLTDLHSRISLRNRDSAMDK